uniref:Uncharacterized protein n=1 Tax=Sphaerodactylus townsendi TaxID=933632 RepID=A0ACB8G4C7_9SAUR
MCYHLRSADTYPDLYGDRELRLALQQQQPFWVRSEGGGCPGGTPPPRAGPGAVGRRREPERAPALRCAEQTLAAQRKAVQQRLVERHCEPPRSVLAPGGGHIVRGRL